MKQSVWSMHDKRAGIYHDPIMYRNDDVALLSMKRSIIADLESNNLSASVLEEFEFVKIAEFDDRSGKYLPIDELERKRVPLEFE